MSTDKEYEIVCRAATTKDVDLIVLTHNGLEVTREFIRLLNAHTDKSLFNLIVVDNGSTDDTPMYLRDTVAIEDNATVILHKDNLGVIGGRNLGFEVGSKESGSEYIMFLDNDQYVGSGWLEQHKGIMDRGYDVLGVEAWQMNANYLPRQKVEHIRHYFNYVGCGGMLIRRKVIDKIGLFDEQFNPAYFEDPDFCLRANRESFVIGWNPKAILVHLGHATLGSLDTAAKQKRFFASWDKFKKKWKHTRMPVLLQPDLSQVGPGA